jgi:hypothetical protein
MGLYPVTNTSMGYHQHIIRYIILKTSINQLINWPNGPMARRLTTIQSAIKRFQVRPLVRSKQLFTAIISFLRPSGSGRRIERDCEVVLFFLLASLR